MPIPELILHHYTSGTGLLGILDTGKIWATSIHSLNDSTEFSHAVGVGKTAISRALQSTGVARATDLYEPIASHLDSVSKLAIYVSCFSAVEDSLSQWRGYCPPAFGYSIGFNADLLTCIAAPQGFRLDKCIYDHATQQATADVWARCTVERLMANLPPAESLSDYVRDNCGQFLKEFVHFAPFLKHPAFKDEHEWRLTGLVPANDPRIQVRAGRSMLLRYLAIELNLDKTNPLLWNIRVGPTPHPELAMSAVGHYFNKVLIQNGIGPSQTPYRDW